MADLGELKLGDLIEVTDSGGMVRAKRALGPVTESGDFPVVWACREEEWQAAMAEGRKPDGLPWPTQDVRLAEAAPA